MIWALADLVMGVMATVNLAALLPLSGVAFLLFGHYRRQRAEGKDPTFHRDEVPEISGIQVWDEAPEDGRISTHG